MPPRNGPRHYMTTHRTIFFIGSNIFGMTELRGSSMFWLEYTTPTRYLITLIKSVNRNYYS